MKTTKEVYQYGTKPENPVRVIEINMPPGFIVKNRESIDDIQTLKNDLQWYKDEVINLERDIKDLEIALFDRESDIVDLEDEIDELKIRLETFGTLES